ncbi:hypothetical protein H0264_29205 [Nocardia huaxiensis]|uniref:Uncharacterized protein n=1 Tax=Nocardia huaxiensis TaxID=2755382 RepID=A0A7D6ZJL8_9NOCA|nr:hypothetical protein [Nocardia huaxiensis]QLY29323.1 hypothetical protein H0264_29205 [Nocardia huaxiensis]
MAERDPHAGTPAAALLELLEERVRGVSGYCEHLHRNELPRLSADIARLRTEFAALNARFTAVLAHQHRAEEPDTTTTDHLSHYEITHQLRSFVEQDLRRAATAFLAPGVSYSDRAQLIGRCAAALFEHAEIDRAAIEEIFRSDSIDTAQLEYDIMQRAAEIRQAATDLGHDYRWDFTCEPGTPLDAGTQEPWGVCDPDQPAAFVVVPAYYVSRRLLLKQQVVTSEDPDHLGT